MQQVQLHIPEPCHENWAAMESADSGRFCLSCQKTVVDFTNMTDHEVLLYLQRAQGNTCGRFAPDQINRPLTQQMPLRKHFWGKWVVQLLFPVFVFSQKAKAQGFVTMVKIQPPVATAPHKKSTEQQHIAISGKITDSITGVAIAHASIKVMGSKLGSQSSKDGSFVLSKLAKGKPVRLKISCIGYKSTEVIVSDFALPLLIKLTSEIVEMAPLIIYSDHYTRKGLIKTTVTIIRYVPLITRIADTLTGSNQIRIYPNPVARGNAIQFNMKKVRKGQYRLQLFSATGSLVQQEIITVPAEDFNLQWSLGSQVAAGNYIVNISHTNGKAIHNSKITIL